MAKPLPNLHRGGPDAPRIMPAPAPPASAPTRRGSANYDATLWRLKPMIDEAEGPAFRLGIVPCSSRTDGGSYAAKLALRAADLGFGPVLLVDANFADPSVRQTFGVRSCDGLVDCLVERRAAASCIFPSGVEGLDVLCTGDCSLLRGAAITADRLAELAPELKESYALAVFNLPAPGELGPALPIAQGLDASLLVVRSESTSGSEGRLAVNRLAIDGVPVTGAVLTETRDYLPRWLRRWF